MITVAGVLLLAAWAILSPGTAPSINSVRGTAGASSTEYRSSSQIAKGSMRDHRPTTK